MSRDNVTPFRKRRPPPKQMRQGPPLSTHRGRAVAVQVLALLSGVLLALEFVPFLLPFFGLPLIAIDRNLLSIVSIVVSAAGFLIASSNRHTAMPWAATHHEFALRTIVVGICGSALGSAMGFLGPLAYGGLVLWAVTSVWVIGRSVLGVVFAAMRRPMRHPKGWLI